MKAEEQSIGALLQFLERAPVNSSVSQLARMDSVIRRADESEVVSFYRALESAGESSGYDGIVLAQCRRLAAACRARMRAILFEDAMHGIDRRYRLFAATVGNSSFLREACA